jgi:hypothetical protein
MYDLEIKLQGEKQIADKMSEFLPNKTNEQIRDKRAEKTYKTRIKEILEQRSWESNRDDLGEESIHLSLDEINRRASGSYNLNENCEIEHDHIRVTNSAD